MWAYCEVSNVQICCFVIVEATFIVISKLKIKLRFILFPSSTDNFWDIFETINILKNRKILRWNIRIFLDHVTDIAPQSMLGLN